MKLKNVVLALILTATSSVHAALITLNNGSGATATGIQTLTGATFRSGTNAGDAFATGGGTSAGAGVVAFGTFSTDALSGVNSVSTLLSYFTQFGSTTTFNLAGTTGNRSVFSSAQSATVTGSAFETSNIYLLVGNASTLAASTQFLVVKSTLLFNSVSDSTATPTTLTINNSNGTVLFGTSVANVQTANNDSSTTPGWQLAAVPEPSAALLGLLGVFGLARRRR